MTPESGTLFSTREFIEAWARAHRGKRPLEVAVPGSGPPRSMYALATPWPLGLQSVELGPAGLYGSPGWDGELAPSTVRELLASLRKPSTLSLVWNVRHDHELLARRLEAEGLEAERLTTHVLPLGAGHDAVFAGYSTTKRNEVRAAERRGVQVRRGTTADDVRAYHRVHTGLVEEKADGRRVYALEVLNELVGLGAPVQLWLAELEGQVVAGGVFCRDGDSVLYWHGAADRTFARSYPSAAVLDAAIRDACAAGARTFNLGASNGIASLEQFKEQWGGRIAPYWRFIWRTPLLRPLFALRSYLART